MITLPNTLSNGARDVTQIQENFDDLAGRFTSTTSPTFSSSYFTGSDSMVWSVSSASKYSYDIVNGVMRLSFSIGGSSVTGTPSDVLKIAIPDGYQAKGGDYNTVLLIDNGTRTDGYASAATNATYVSICKQSGGNFSLSSSNTGVFGQLSFELKP